MTPKKSVSQIQSISLSFQGAVFGMVLVFIALLSMDLGKLHFGFSFVPVAVIYYWPREASYTWSLLFIFLLGLFYDMSSASSLGMWTLAFIIIFLVLDGAPKGRSGLGRALVEYALSVMFCFVIVFLLGWLSLGRLPQVSILLGNAFASIVIFPIFYWLRSMFVNILGPSVTLGFRE